jgi:hypothetical protein
MATFVVGAEPAAAWNDVSRYFALGLPAADLRALVAALGRDPMLRRDPTSRASPTLWSPMTSRT